MTGFHLTPRNALFLLVAVGGVYTLSSYFYILPQIGRKSKSDIAQKTQSFDELWFGISPSERQLFYISMIIAAIAFCIATGRFMLKITWSQFPSLCISYCIFFAGAILWTFSLWWWSFGVYANLANISVIVALCLTTLGAAMLVREAWVVHRDIIATVAMSLVLVHVALFDNGRWAFAFLESNYKS